MTGILVDPFPSDEALRSLWLKAWGNRGAGSFQSILSRSLAHVGAYDSQTLVGFVNVAWDGGIHAFIVDTCVDPDWRRRGIAMQMLKKAEEAARERGAEWLHVDYEAHLAPLYESCGFRPTAAGLIALRA
jgi:ribosomal protein S18 acetylase RimI-like enzyme